MAPVASTSKLPRGRPGKPKDTSSLLSNTRELPAQSEYVPPTQSLKKYVYSSSTLVQPGHLASKLLPSKKLAHRLAETHSSAKASAVKNYEHDDLLLERGRAGLMETEGEMERTWKVTQKEILEGSAVGTESKAFSLKLDQFGPYEMDYTRNGRHLAIAGKKGHIGTFDWHSGRLHTELHLKETCRAIRWLHDESFFAVAQKKFVYIYDKSGLEVHQLRNHVEVNKMEFLPYHFLLATVGNAGYLKYQDTSTGQLVSEMRTKLGACSTMAVNPHNAFISLGHQNGTITLWSPSVSSAQITLLAHRGPVTSIALDPSTLGNRMVTTGLDGNVKVWDIRTWKELNEWGFKKTPKSAGWSQKGLLGVGWGNHISVFNDLQKPGQSAHLSPTPYLTHTFPSTAVQSLAFCPYDDILGVGHAAGFTSLVVPGAGEANFDSLEADPFEGKRRRREREVNALLDKIPMDMITLDTALVGKLDLGVSSAFDKLDRAREKPGFKETSFSKQTRLDRLKTGGKIVVLPGDEEDGESSEEEDKEGEMREKRKEDKIEKGDAKKRARGRNSTLKKMLRKRKRNVVDPITVALKEKLVSQRKATAAAKQNVALARSIASGTAGALDRFSIGK